MTQYECTSYRFCKEPIKHKLALQDAAEAVYSRQVDAVTVEITTEEEALTYWKDGESINPTVHRHHQLLSASGVTMGQLQRETGQDFILKLADYFTNSAIENRQHEHSKFIQLLKSKLDAKPYAFAEKSELLIATKRIYRPNRTQKYNFSPHTDSIAFARETDLWPVGNPSNQIAVFFLVQGSINDAPVTIWNREIGSRAELDDVMTKFQSGNFSDLEDIERLEIRPTAGQITIFSSHRLHAVGQCSSERRTIGTFLVQESGNWFLCH